MAPWHPPNCALHVRRQLSLANGSLPLVTQEMGTGLGSPRGSPACARVVRVCQVAGAGWEQEGSVCVVPCAVLRTLSSPREAPALLQCLQPRVSGSTGAGPQNCSGAGTGVGCQLAQGSRGHRAVLAGEGGEQDPQCALWLLVSVPGPACKGGRSSCILHSALLQWLRRRGAGPGGGSRACAQGPACAVLAAAELGHGLGCCPAGAPGPTGPRSEWTDSPRVLPGAAGRSSSGRAQCVLGWEQ